jgi:hypothetical protein
MTVKKIDIDLLVEAGLDLDELFEGAEWFIIREIHYCVVDPTQRGPNRMASGCVWVERAEVAGIVGFRWSSGDDLGNESRSQVSADEAWIHEQAEDHAEREDSCESYEDLVSDIMESGFFPSDLGRHWVEALLDRMSSEEGCVLLRPGEWDFPKVVPAYHSMNVPYIRVACRCTEHDNAKALRDQILKYQG